MGAMARASANPMPGRTPAARAAWFAALTISRLPSAATSAKGAASGTAPGSSRASRSSGNSGSQMDNMRLTPASAS